MRGETLIEGRNGFAGSVLRQERVVVVGLDLLRGDVNAGPETQLDEAQNLKPVAQVGIDPLRGQIVRGQESPPSGIGGAVLADTGGEFLAYLCETRIHFVRRGLRGLCFLAANLLLDEGAADQLIECAPAVENALPDPVRIENRQADFVVDVAGQDGMAVDHGHHAVKHHGGCRLSGLGDCRSGCEAGGKAEPDERCARWAYPIPL